MSWLDREAASFDQSVWDAIDAAVQAAAAEVRAGRKVMSVEGPGGISLRAGLSDEEPIAPSAETSGAHIHVPSAHTLPLIHQTFLIGVRSIEAFLVRNEPLDLEQVSEAARVVARSEEKLLFLGEPAAHVAGLLNHRGAIRMTLSDWSDPGHAADDLLAAVARLDAEGRNGPYAAALAPARYWQLLRPYSGSALTPYAQLTPAFEGGLIKAPTLADGGVILSKTGSGPRVLVGQDIDAAYDGREGIFHRFSLLESVTLLEGAPGSVAVLAP